MLATVVVALGGNAILQRGEKGTAQEQMENVRATAIQIASLIKIGYRVILTHGNGPQVGNILIQNEIARDRVPAMSMDICGAQSQGMIGYMMQMHIGNALRKMGMDIPITTVVTQMLVNKDDPAFKNPGKPVGPFKDERYAKTREDVFGETWTEDSGRGWRRVVPSPDPETIVEAASIKTLVDAGHMVISVGGGGVPVVRDWDGSLKGVEAVIDKDLGAERLASAVGADMLLILTDVQGAALNYGTPEQRWLERVTYSELSGYLKDGYFKKGSMKPKVRALLRFFEHGGKEGVIASLSRVLDAVQGRSGTRLSAGE